MSIEIRTRLHLKAKSDALRLRRALYALACQMESDGCEPKAVRCMLNLSNIADSIDMMLRVTDTDKPHNDKAKRKGL